MVYVHDDLSRVREKDLDVPDTKMERFTHFFVLLCSVAFIVSVGLYMASPRPDGFMMTMALGSGGLFTVSLAMFFGVIFRDH